MMGASPQAYDLPTILGEDLPKSSRLPSPSTVVDAAHILPHDTPHARGRAHPAPAPHPPAARHRNTAPPAALLAGIVPLPALLESMGAPCSSASDCKTDLVRRRSPPWPHMLPPPA